MDRNVFLLWYGHVMCNHELVKFAEDRDSDVSTLIAIEALELSEDLNPLVDLARKFRPQTFGEFLAYF
ncbi:hypothetical protein AYI68_g2324 [Smittium mucronatum]|uniref:Uncharacterized protein n=1 Tax=Smittium mucronatum TaxID=133383 RepID=A0A1R0H373_9FUNG|nr:hypothetical protein AYI68_g2324 [Smittium mucronatum]